jgi:hypothetical protein
MPLTAVPRWRPLPSYTVTRSYLDALPHGWSKPYLGVSSIGTYAMAAYDRYKAAQPVGVPPYKSLVLYEVLCMTRKERESHCIASYGPTGSVGIWRPVLPADWDALDGSQLHLVQAHRVTDTELDPQYSPSPTGAELWQYPYWYRREVAPVYQEITGTTRVDWDTVQKTKQGA